MDRGPLILVSRLGRSYMQSTLSSVGKSVNLYQNAGMGQTNFFVFDKQCDLIQTITKDDIRPQLVCGEGKRARLLDTIGTTRGFGDHDLEVQYAAGIKIKPFLTAQPEVYCLSVSFRRRHNDS